MSPVQVNLVRERYIQLLSVCNSSVGLHDQILMYSQWLLLIL